MFGAVCKKLHFLRQTIEIANLSLHCFAPRPTGTQNQDSRPPSDSFRRHESNGCLRFDKRPSVENYIFRAYL